VRARYCMAHPFSNQIKLGMGAGDADAPLLAAFSQEAGA
jgi:hypothetical protein